MHFNRKRDYGMNQLLLILQVTSEKARTVKTKSVQWNGYVEALRISRVSKLFILYKLNT